MNRELKVNTRRFQGTAKKQIIGGAQAKPGKNFENISQSKHLIGIQIQLSISYICCTGTQVIMYIMGTVFFWVIMQQVVVISNQRFRTTYQSHRQGLRIQKDS